MDIVLPWPVVWWHLGPINHASVEGFREAVKLSSDLGYIIFRRKLRVADGFVESFTQLRAKPRAIHRQFCPSDARRVAKLCNRRTCAKRSRGF